MTQRPTDTDSPDPQNPGEAPNRSPAGEPRRALDIPHEESVNEDMNTFTIPFASQDAMALLAQELTPKRAVSYLRVSTREQAQRGGHEEGFSIPAQRAANKRKAKTVGATIVKEFVERGASGTSTRRPALQAMLRYLEETIASGETIDYVIVHKLDRLARNRADDVVLNQRFDELGTRLISTSENIDQTPGGMLLHGIMASISEFYSNNLSSEVKKGMSEKARNGGCISKAPLGYRNTTTTSNGREAHVATIDPDRAELITWAFDAYATGRYTLKSLTAELQDRGLTTQATASLPSRPVSVQSLHRILSNPFYTGQVVYRDCLYPGAHQALVDQQTFQQVQAILAGRVNGERTIRHPHYLKSTVYCGICGSRLIITTARPKKTTYQYFICLGRHSRRQPDCTFRAALTETVEDEVEQLYQRIHLQPQRREELEQALRHQLARMIQDTQQQLTQITATQQKLKHQQEKLLQAHYEGAIPVELLRKEQHRITHSLTTANRRIQVLEQDLGDKEELVSQALDIAQHMASAYHHAPTHIRRMLNQLLFEHVYLVPHEDTSQLTATATCLPPFDSILGWGGDEDGNWSSEGTTGLDENEGQYHDQPHTPQPPGAAQRGHENAGGHEVANISPATQPPNRPRDPKPPEAVQNKPCSTQKPTPEVSQDVGLSVEHLVGVTGFEPATSPSRTVRATKLRHTPTSSLVYPTSEYNKSMSLERYLANATLLSEQITLRELAIILRELARVQAVPGAVVEFGCYVGTTSIHIARWLGGKQFHVYDSFAGLPEKTAFDISPVGEQFRPGELLATKKQFMTNFKKAGVPLPHIHKGWFHDLHSSDVPASVSFVFLDGDYYESILTPLRLIEDKLADGAVIVVDDYANEALPGAARAVDEWLRTHPARLRVEQSLAVIHPQSTMD